ncbi:TonB-dependent receptor [Belliella sp. DSM 111904]|uniref:TonB-dependent receptor n=1 Tax=Belliella filtrata TaxID=2923435 RepID=A0ABS9UYH1_9BACT|nr:TonB-dependent receptor [Belliella filtrata]MCH7408990.1 TonB-dependent receptor [Belliella filtrata]
MQIKTLCIALAIYGLNILASQAQNTVLLEGKVLSPSLQPLENVGVYIKELGTGLLSNQDGSFSFTFPRNNNYSLKISHLGYREHEINFSTGTDFSPFLEIILEEAEMSLEQVVVNGKNMVREVKETAFPVEVVDGKGLHHTTLDLAHALDRVSGVRIRENGGLGSGMNLSLNGFSGRQVKVFMDGIPMDNMGTSFQLNNIPINLASRIEVYKGVVPVGLGADALGGAINIVTQTFEKSHIDASYAFGSFNTHRTAINAVHVGKGGFVAQVNAFQNYSANNYKVNVDVADINTGQYFPDQWVRRFHDTYHNETVITQLGWVNKPFADRLLVGATLGKNYSEIQTGARMVTVFGSWHRRGTIVMPTFRYEKKGLFSSKLDMSFNANYNLGTEQNIDTLNRRYNWFGQYKTYEGPGGERSRTLYKFSNNNGLTNTTLNYRIDDKSSLTFNHVLNTFNRKGSDELFPDDAKYDQPQVNTKNILGLSYQFRNNEKWGTTVFAKSYNQVTNYTQSFNPTGQWGDVAYQDVENAFNHLGYGTALTYFPKERFQVKASFEKSYRLPETEELFGDLINLAANIDLKPESSYNYNLGFNYWSDSRRNKRINASTNFFYRDARDFIRARLNNNQVMQVMENLGFVLTKGVEADVRVFLKEQWQAGITMTYQDLRNNTQYEAGQQTVSILYKDRIPNMPYLFGNIDLSYGLDNVKFQEDRWNIGMNMRYVHEFYLYWPSLGSDKLTVPQQVSIDLESSYTFGKKSKYQFTFECRNLLDTLLYDNFSLQKPGRNFTGKIRYFFL